MTVEKLIDVLSNIVEEVPTISNAEITIVIEDSYGFRSKGISEVYFTDHKEVKLMVRLKG